MKQILPCTICKTLQEVSMQESAMPEFMRELFGDVPQVQYNTVFKCCNCGKDNIVSITISGEPE